MEKVEKSCLTTDENRDRTPATPSAAAVSMPKFTPATNGGPKRIIKKITYIDPEKIKQLGLEQKIAEAVNKLQAKTLASIQSKSPNKFTAPRSNSSEVPGKFKVFLYPKSAEKPKDIKNNPTTSTSIKELPNKSNFLSLSQHQSSASTHFKSLFNKKLLEKKQQNKDQKSDAFDKESRKEDIKDKKSKQPSKQKIRDNTKEEQSNEKNIVEIKQSESGNCSKIIKSIKNVTRKLSASMDGQHKISKLPKKVQKSEIKTQSSTELKKKRGRPRKNQSNCESQVSISDSPLSESEINAVKAIQQLHELKIKTIPFTKDIYSEKYKETPDSSQSSSSREEFYGFSANELESEEKNLNRLSNLLLNIEKSGGTLGDTNKIPSFSNLRNYLQLKRVQNESSENSCDSSDVSGEKSYKKFSEELEPSMSSALKAADTKKMYRRKSVPLSVLKVTKKACASTFKTKELKSKTGIDLFLSTTVLNDKEVITKQNVEEDKKIVPSQLIADPEESSTSDVTGSRTVFLKVLNRDPKSGNVEVELIDPLIQVEKVQAVVTKTTQDVTTLEKDNGNISLDEENAEKSGKSLEKRVEVQSEHENLEHSPKVAKQQNQCIPSKSNVNSSMHRQSAFISLPTQNFQDVEKIFFNEPSTSKHSFSSEADEHHKTIAMEDSCVRKNIIATGIKKNLEVHSKKVSPVSSQTNIESLSLSKSGTSSIREEYSTNDSSPQNVSRTLWRQALSTDNIDLNALSDPESKRLKPKSPTFDQPLDSLLSQQAIKFENVETIEEELNKYLESSDQEDAVDFLLSCGDQLNKEESEESLSSDCDSICFDDFDILLEANMNQKIKSEVDDTFDSLADQSFKNEQMMPSSSKQDVPTNLEEVKKASQIHFNIDNDDDEMESPDYEHVSVIDSTEFTNEEVEELDQLTSEQQMNLSSNVDLIQDSKPIVIENKILSDQEKIDFLNLNGDESRSWIGTTTQLPLSQNTPQFNQTLIMEEDLPTQEEIELVSTTVKGNTVSNFPIVVGEESSNNFRDTEEVQIYSIDDREVLLMPDKPITHDPQQECQMLGKVFRLNENNEIELIHDVELSAMNIQNNIQKCDAKSSKGVIDLVAEGESEEQASKEHNVVISAITIECYGQKSDAKSNEEVIDLIDLRECEGQTSKEDSQDVIDLVDYNSRSNDDLIIDSDQYSKSSIDAECREKNNLLILKVEGNHSSKTELSGNKKTARKKFKPVPNLRSSLKNNRKAADIKSPKDIMQDVEEETGMHTKNKNDQEKTEGTPILIITDGMLIRTSEMKESRTLTEDDVKEAELKSSAQDPNLTPRNISRNKSTTTDQLEQLGEGGVTKSCNEDEKIIIEPESKQNDRIHEVIEWKVSSVSPKVSVSTIHFPCPAEGSSTNRDNTVDTTRKNRRSRGSSSNQNVYEEEGDNVSEGTTKVDLSKVLKSTKESVTQKESEESSSKDFKDIHSSNKVLKSPPFASEKSDPKSALQTKVSKERDSPKKNKVGRIRRSTPSRGKSLSEDIYPKVSSDLHSDLGEVKIDKLSEGAISTNDVNMIFNLKKIPVMQKENEGSSYEDSNQIHSVNKDSATLPLFGKSDKKSTLETKIDTKSDSLKKYQVKRIRKSRTSRGESISQCVESEREIIDPKASSDLHSDLYQDKVDKLSERTLETNDLKNSRKKSVMQKESEGSSFKVSNQIHSVNKDLVSLSSPLFVNGKPDQKPLLETKIEKHSDSSKKSKVAKLRKNIRSRDNSCSDIEKEDISVKVCGDLHDDHVAQNILAIDHRIQKNYSEDIQKNSFQKSPPSEITKQTTSSKTASPTCEPENVLSYGEVFSEDYEIEIGFIENVQEAECSPRQNVQKDRIENEPTKNESVIDSKATAEGFDMVQDDEPVSVKLQQKMSDDAIKSPEIQYKVRRAKKRPKEENSEVDVSLGLKSEKKSNDSLKDIQSVNKSCSSVNKRKRGPRFKVDHFEDDSIIDLSISSQQITKKGLSTLENYSNFKENILSINNDKDKKIEGSSNMENSLEVQNDDKHSPNHKKPTDVPLEQSTVIPVVRKRGRPRKSDLLNKDSITPPVSKQPKIEQIDNYNYNAFIEPEEIQVSAKKRNKSRKSDVKIPIPTPEILKVVEESNVTRSGRKVILTEKRRASGVLTDFKQKRKQIIKKRISVDTKSEIDLSIQVMEDKPVEEVDEAKSKTSNAKKKKGRDDFVINISEQNSKSDDNEIMPKKKDYKRIRVISSNSESEEDVPLAVIFNKQTNKNRQEQSPENLKRKVGRPKTIKKSCEKLDKSKEANSPVITGSEKRPRKVEEKLDSVSKTSASEELVRTYKRSKGTKNKRKHDIDIKLHPRLLIATKREDIYKKVEEPAPVKLGSNEVQCGLCKEVVQKTGWKKHIESHYCIGWIEGEPPIDVEDYRVVLNAMVYYMKVHKIKFFDCRFCGMPKKSAAGILYHIETCQASQDEKTALSYVCICGKTLSSKQNLIPHLNTCRGNQENQKIGESSVQVDENAASLGKRKAVLKAEKMMKEALNEESVENENDLIKTYVPRGMGAMLKWKNDLRKNGSACCIALTCDFTSSELSELIAHYKTCAKMLQKGFACTQCTFKSANKNDALQHVRTKHCKKEQNDFEASNSEAEVAQDSSSDSDCSSGVNEEAEKKPRNKKKDTTDKQERVIPDIGSEEFRKIFNLFNYHSRNRYTSEAEKWTKEFQESNYSNYPLFTGAIPNATKLPASDFHVYSPNNSYSMKFSYNCKEKFNKNAGSSKKPEIWNELEVFKSEVLFGDLITYIGGPVTSLAWIPINNNQSSSTQYLAVTYKKDFNHYVHQINPEKQQICMLICEVGTYDCIKEKKPLKILYGIPYDWGPILDIKFLPSGGYAPELNRLGVVAVSTTEVNVNIYSLPLKAPNNCDRSNSFPLLELKPSFVLSVDLLRVDQRNFMLFGAQCSSLSWSKFKGHTKIVGGFLNGCIAVWDISEDDNLNCYEENGVRHFVPVNYFQVLIGRLLCVDFHYDADGPRWVMASTENKEIKIFDLCNATPMLQITDEMGRCNSNSFDWPMYWENPVLSQSDELRRGTTGITSFSPLGIAYRFRKSIRSASGTISVSFNEWQNACIVGSQNGDICVFRCYEWRHDVGSRRSYDDKFLSYTDMIRLDDADVLEKFQSENRAKEASVELFDPDYRHKYGLILSSLTKCQYIPGYADASQKRDLDFHLQQYVKINRVASNPNECGNEFFAAGYENGLVRIFLFNTRNNSSTTFSESYDLKV